MHERAVQVSEKVFWVGLGLSCGPGSGQLGSESILSGVEAWMVPCSGMCRSLKTSLGPGGAQLGNPAALFILVGVFRLGGCCDVTSRRPTPFQTEV